MVKEMELLWELQQIEKEEKKLIEAYNVLVKNIELKNLYQIILSEMKEYERLENTLKDKREKQTQIEKEIKEIEKKYIENESFLYSGKIKNYKEMEMLSDNLKKLKDVKAEKEEILLRYMEEVYQLENLIKQISNKIRKMQKEYKEIRLKNNEDIDKIKKEIEKLRDCKLTLAEKIKPELLTIYKKIKLTKTDPVAKVVDFKCSGCNTILSFAKIQEVSQHTLPVYCESCGRLIFAE